MTEVVILLGSNINPAENIRRGAFELCKQIPVLRSSSVWLTPAIGQVALIFITRQSFVRLTKPPII
jgi:7,8-dihydro-6-hydroxymethylpterin-pyrophosphokinase